MSHLDFTQRSLLTITLSRATSLQCNSNSGAIEDILQELLPEGYDEVSDLDRVGDTNCLYGGLNLIYGLDGSGKSWQTVVSMKDVDNVVYIDTDGSNGTMFVKHCKEHSIHYIKNDVVENYKRFYKNGNGEQVEVSLLKRVRNLIEDITERSEGKMTFILDSLTSMAEGMGINNAENISPLLYKMNSTAANLGIAIVLIDHSTEKPDYADGFSLEGNKGAKRRTTVTVNKYIPLNKEMPQKGGVFKCERARGNNDGLKIGDILTISNTSVDDVINWFKSNDKRKRFLEEEFTKAEFTKLTQNTRDKWVRDFVDMVFDSRVEDKTTYYIIKTDLLT